MVPIEKIYYKVELATLFLDDFLNKISNFDLGNTFSEAQEFSVVNLKKVIQLKYDLSGEDIFELFDGNFKNVHNAIHGLFGDDPNTSRSAIIEASGPYMAVIILSGKSTATHTDSGVSIARGSLVDSCVSESTRSFEICDGITPTDLTDEYRFRPGEEQDGPAKWRLRLTCMTAVLKDRYPNEAPPLLTPLISAIENVAIGRLPKADSWVETPTGAEFQAHLGSDPRFDLPCICDPWITEPGGNREACVLFSPENVVEVVSPSGSNPHTTPANEEYPSANEPPTKRSAGETAPDFSKAKIAFILGSLGSSFPGMLDRLPDLLPDLMPDYQRDFHGFLGDPALMTMISPPRQAAETRRTGASKPLHDMAGLLPWDTIGALAAADIARTVLGLHANATIGLSNGAVAMAQILDGSAAARACLSDPEAGTIRLIRDIALENALPDEALETFNIAGPIDDIIPLVTQDPQHFTISRLTDDMAVVQTSSARIAYAKDQIDFRFHTNGLRPTLLHSPGRRHGN